MAFGTIAAIAIGLGAAAAGVVGAKMASKGPSEAPKPLPMPQAPSVDAVAEKASDNMRKKKATMSQSIYTSPLGVSGEAAVARKTLLGS